jgi:hypothetical protein
MFSDIFLTFYGLYTAGDDGGTSVALGSCALCMRYKMFDSLIVIIASREEMPEGTL